MRRAARGLVIVALVATGCPGAKHDRTPTTIGNAPRGDGTEPVDAGTPDATASRPSDPEEAWLHDIRAQLRAMDLGRCTTPGVVGVDAVCLCADACALALPPPPSAGNRVVDWSDSLKLYVDGGGAITACAARPTAGAAWVSDACRPGAP